MKHRVAGRKLGRTSSHRLALLRNLSTQLFDRERIITTLTKAKELRPFAEKLVTLSKKETLHARRQVLRHIHDRAVVAKLFDTLSARYAQRPGGYTRILRLGPRRGDNAELAMIELVDAEGVRRKTKGGKSSKEKAPREKSKKSAGEDGGGTEKKKKATRKKTAAKKTKTTRKRKAASSKDSGKKAEGGTSSAGTRKKKATARKKTAAKKASGRSGSRSGGEE